MSHPLIHICVLYGDGKHLLRLFESYARQNFDFRAWPVKFVIVNNNESKIGPPEFEFPEGIDYSIINAGKNLGYFGAAQFAIQEISPRESDWTVISNSDLEFTSNDFFTTLKNLKVKNDVGVVAPLIKSELSGTNQNPYLLSRPSSRRMKFLKTIFASDVVSLALPKPIGRQAHARCK